jgi:hypothetical protein
MIMSEARRRIEATRPQVNVDRNPEQRPAEVSLGAFEAQIAFVKPCKAAAVKVDYVWQIKGPQVAPVRKTRVLGCVKVLGRWICT